MHADVWDVPHKGYANATLKVAVYELVREPKIVLLKRPAHRRFHYVWRDRHALCHYW